VQVFDAGSYPRDDTRAAVTIGVYDGVHRGHHVVLSRLCTVATTQGLVSVVVTFDPHPAAIVAPQRAPRLLTTLDRRLELLAASGVDRCVVVGFDPARSSQEPQAFVQGLLVDELRAAAIVVGENFRFGRGRGGDVALLRALAAGGGYEVDGVALDALAGEVVSSSRIRELLLAGDVEGAARLLGRDHELEGTVVRGDGRGRALGFPTANLDVVAGLCVPEVGIYAGTWSRPSGDRHAAAISVGRRPTFYEDADVLVEAHLCDFDEAIYGELGRLEFRTRLRDEERFESVDALVEQIRLDVERTRQLISV
jgi:riboflavin kinase/FMN adenylyltransferase